MLTGAATWAGRKYGHNVSGLLIGLPLNAGPIAFFLALQHGDVFAAESAKGVLFGVVSFASYATAYAMLSRKFNVWTCVIAGWVIYLLGTYLLNQISFSLLVTFLLTMLALAMLLIIFPKFKEESTTVKPPKWDIPLRIILATLFIIGLTYISGRLGPQLSGLLTTFPIFGTIFAATTHYLYGSNACIRLLRNAVLSMLSFAVFFLIIALYIRSLGVLQAFVLATVLCLLVQFLVLMLSRRLAKKKRV